MIFNGVEIDDTYAEAFSMLGSRAGHNCRYPGISHDCSGISHGFATSVIGCGCEAGIESELDPARTPDGRPGVSVLIFGVSLSALESQLIARVGQAIMTCPTTACYNGLEGEKEINVGGKLRYFGDSYQASKMLDGKRFWRIPVMDGEFLVQEKFGVKGDRRRQLIDTGERCRLLP